MHDAKFYRHRDPFTIEAARPTRSEISSPGRKKILAVDDGPGSLNDYCLLLEEAGYQVIRCGGSLAALFAIVREEPDLVFAEIRKPLMNGVALTAELKAHSDTRHIPVLMFASKDNPRTRALAAQAECDGFVTRQLAPQPFLALVAKLLRTPKAKDLPKRPTAFPRRDMRRATVGAYPQRDSRPAGSHRHSLP